MLTVGSLFAGIGGLDLGLERAGMRVAWQSEIDPYASAVLRKHWPAVPNHGDIRGIRAGTVEPVDLICGGFPCQDISNAGKRAGIDGERSGLWGEFARIIGELRPRYVIVENVAALLGRGIERVLRDLASLGFDAEWHCIPASAVGAPHERDRLFLVANPPNDGRLFLQRITGQLSTGSCVWESIRTTSSDEELAALGCFRGKGNGIPADMDRLKCLGNAIVPQIAEILGRAIIDAEMRAAA